MTTGRASSLTTSLGGLQLNGEGDVMTFSVTHAVGMREIVQSENVHEVQ